MNNNTLKIEINRNIADVFEFSTDPKNTHLWFESIKEETASEYPAKVGELDEKTPQTVLEKLKTLMEHQSMKTYAICGSMRFQEQMIEIAYFYEIENQCAMLVPTLVPPTEHLERGKETDITAIFDKVHKRKIDMCDGIYVVNIGGYIGHSTSSEIAYATRQGKEIIYHEPKNTK